MRHFGGGVGHVKNTVLAAVDSLSDTDMDIDDDEGPSNEMGFALSQADVRMRPELDPEEVDEEVPEGEEGDLDEDEDMNIYDDNDLANDEDEGSDDDGGYASP
jgi:hypothetical protein